MCRELFTEEFFENYRVCNLKKDCKINERCVGHKCVD